MRMMKLMTVGMTILGLSMNTASGQERYATINNCAITLVGDYPELAGIEAASTNGLLVQDTAEIDGIGVVGLNTPFLVNGAVSNFRDGIRLRVGSSFRAARIDATGETQSAILYTGSQDAALDGDLTVSIAVGDGGLESIPLRRGESDDATCSQIEQQVFNGSGFSGLLGGVASDERFITIVDGVVTLNGTFNGLAGIEARSPAERLSQQTAVIEGVGEISLTTPFRSGVTVANRANNVALGVLGKDAKIDIVQSVVKTSIQYDGTQEQAEKDLVVNVGTDGITRPANVAIGGEVGSADGTFELEEGFLALSGSFSRLSGIEASSLGGFLSLDPNITAPFDAAAVVKVDESNGNSILLGVNTAADRVDVEGFTQTAIRYSASEAVALSDLTVRLGIAGQGAVPIVHTNAVPEPTGSVLISLGLLASLAWRHSRGN